VLLMGIGHVFAPRGVAAALQAARMRGHALAFAEDLHGGAAHARLQDLVPELEGHRVVVVLDLHVVIDVRLHLLPLGIHKARGR
jgi:hypothetical protein